jgi:hypothetical protein|tara:strand:+ start:313 stop:558 length:246 start_codon:yes stop_codon:yes gene_type:complete
MNLIDIIDKLRTKIVKKIAYGILVLLILSDFMIPRHEIHFFGDKIRGFWSLFGIISCVLIIVVSKWIGQNWLMRDEDYYDK